MERWFKEFTDKRLRRGVFSSVDDLITAIETWVKHWNDQPTPFVWHTPAAEIIEKVKRGRATLSQIKSGDRALGGRLYGFVGAGRRGLLALVLGG